MRRPKIKLCLNEQGVSLVEVVASITILTFILVAFVNFFPQMGLKNNQNEDKQSAINLVKSELDYWKKKFENSSDFNDFILDPTKPYSFIHSTDVVTSGTDSLGKNIISIETSTFTRTTDFKVEIVIYETPDLNTNPKKAYQVHTKLLNSNNSYISEVYGYIFY